MTKLALITGATSGLGEAAAKALAERGFTVLIAGRDAARGAALVAQIKANNGSAEFIQAELLSKQGILGLAAEVKRRTSALSLLINNAGGTFQKKAMSVDGIEHTFALNTLAPFLLSRALSPELSAAQGRIVNVATGVPKGTKVKLEELAAPKKFSGFSAYSNAKLALIAVTIEQASRLAAKGISVVSIHPGIILGTRFTKDLPKVMVSIMGFVARVFRMNSSPEQATQRFIRAATEEVQSGAFYDQDKLGAAPTQAQDPAFRAQLWSLLEKLS